jgi:hypothetical protein
MVIYAEMFQNSVFSFSLTVDPRLVRTSLRDAPC